jgi:FlaA1/EpsC-like NDP-sugar epimerase/ADP-ribose pyrophosphatase YjhB (NUDIX family)
MIVTFLFWLLALNRGIKRLLQAFFDLLSVVSAGLVMTIWFPALFATEIFAVASSVVVYAALVVVIGYFLGLYRTLIRYLGIKTIATIIASGVGGAIVLWALGQFLLKPLAFTTLLILLAVSMSLMAIGRLIIREVFFLARKVEKPNVLIYGAGDAGRQLLTSLIQSASHRVVAMLDDSPQMQGSEVHGIRVYAPQALSRLKERYLLQAVILAMPTISREQKNKILQQIEPLGLPVKTMPRISDILSGVRSAADIQEVSIEEVLGRDPVPPIASLLGRIVSGRSVMVTGGGGSIGKELCLQIVALSPVKLVIVETSELALYAVVTALQDQERLRGLAIIPVLVSVTQEESIKALCESHAIETVFHAAAYKHVPLVEANPFEGLFNNVFGSISVLSAAASTGVSDLVLISTDKAVRPTNIMGASKRVAELVCQAYAQNFQPLRVSMVRFGNVLSSSGSVIPRFREQIQNGGPVTVTHPEITRYFMTIPEAVELVLQAGGMAQGGDVFLLEMGDPVKISDLAKRMIRLSGYRERITGSIATDNSNTIEIVYTGLRPGEKLYEELLVGGDVKTTEHPKIFKAKERSVPIAVVSAALEVLRKAIDERDITQVYEVLAALGVDYSQPGAEAHELHVPTVSRPERVRQVETAISEQKDLTHAFSGDVQSKAVKDPSIKMINPLLSKLLHGYFLLRRPMTLGVRAIVVNNQDEILLVRHRYEPGWQLPGGGVENGESALDALYRELLEEGGVKMRGSGHLLGSFFNADVSRRDHVLTYLVREFDILMGENISPEIEERGFFPRLQLPEGTTPGTRRRIQECFDSRPVESVW